MGTDFFFLAILLSNILALPTYLAFILYQDRYKQSRLDLKHMQSTAEHGGSAFNPSPPEGRNRQSS